MQGAGCSEAEGEENLTKALDVRERRKDCMHLVEDVEEREQIEKNRKRFQFTIYLLDKIEEM